MAQAIVSGHDVRPKPLIGAKSGTMCGRPHLNSSACLLQWPQRLS